MGFEAEKSKWSFERGGRERQNVKKKKQRKQIGRNNKQFVAVVCC